MESIGSPLLFAGFTAFVLAMLALDLGVFHRKAHVVSFREAAIWSVIWVALALAFNAGVYHWYGPQKGLEFLTGYLIEKALSVDNVFVFVVIFGYFAVPREYQHRVLFWGVLGALIMRAVFIAVGAALIASFHWVLYLFGAFLVLTGIKLFRAGTASMDLEKNPVLNWVKNHLPTTHRYDGQKFFTLQNGRRVATPLLLALVAVEVTDLVFAVDSIPAIFAVTQDPFLVYTSNIFAILGLRSLYFVLEGVVQRFAYLKYGLAMVLVFVGGKMLAADFFKVPPAASLAVIVALLGGSVAISLFRSAREKKADQTPAAA